MIKAIYMKYGLKISTIWFSDNKNICLNQDKVDLLFFHGVEEKNVKNAIINFQYTLVTDLQLTVEEIFKNIKKNFRYEINRSKKENVEFEVFSGSELKKSKNILEYFKKEYEEFTKLKGIKNTYNEVVIKEYIENNNILLTKAFKDTENYAQHIYICDGINARLLYSVSNFRSKGIDSNMVGRANKFLHWNDIEYFKKNGYKILDWGGISSIDEPNGIDIFKKGFGGEVKEYHNIIIGNSLIGKLAVLAKKVKRG
jgi:lipid II:glycine glycyltransferase (peptidoglycan interpeptide bridge formation enzyme)